MGYLEINPFSTWNSIKKQQNKRTKWLLTKDDLKAGILATIPFSEKFFFFIALTPGHPLNGGIIRSGDPLDTKVLTSSVTGIYIHTK